MDDSFDELQISIDKLKEEIRKLDSVLENFGDGTSTSEYQNSKTKLEETLKNFIDKMNNPD
jgi:hypothetical protein